MDDPRQDRKLREVAIMVHAAVTCALQDFDISIEAITSDVKLFDASKSAARSIIFHLKEKS